MGGGETERQRKKESAFKWPEKHTKNLRAFRRVVRSSFPAEL